MTTTRDAMPEIPVRVMVQGDVPDSARALAVEKLLLLTAHAPRPVREIRVTLAVEPDPARERPSIAKASIDVDGRVVRGQVASEGMAQAVELLEGHLSRRLRDLAERDQTARRQSGTPEPGEWHRGGPRTLRPEFFPRAPGERQVLRRKTYAAEPVGVEEAAWEMRMLDHDFHLFTNADTGEENVLYTDEGGSLRLRQPAPTGEMFIDPVFADADPAPTASEREAIELLDLEGGPFLFFLDRETGRGNLLYRRYDGHYGIVLPA